MRLFSYWTGPIGWMERLSIASIRAAGDELTVFSHVPDLAARELGCAVADAHDVLDDAKLDRLRTRLPAIYADRFRLEGISQGRGAWVDLDLLMLKPMPDKDFLFGWECCKAINNAVLRMPPDSAILGEYLHILRRNPTLLSAPQRPWRKKAGRLYRSAVRRLRGAEMLFPDTGPMLLTHLVKKHGLAAEAAPPSVFYPVAPPDVQDFHSGTDATRHIRPDTVAMHLWRDRYRRVNGKGVPPRDSWLWQRMEELGVAEADRQLDKAEIWPSAPQVAPLPQPTA